MKILRPEFRTLDEAIKDPEVYAKAVEIHLNVQRNLGSSRSRPKNRIADEEIRAAVEALKNRV